ncbi:MAG: DUF2283 domain-containing protein [Bacteroidota bacterium]|nr:DUF2283 domain-containing protein [Bacteroidota bacterium]
MNNSIKIDIQEIIELIKEQESERTDIIESLNKCKDGYWQGSAYYCFVNSTNANKTGAEWQYVESIEIEDTVNGDIIIDLLKDGRIGGIEFLRFI